MSDAPAVAATVGDTFFLLAPGEDELHYIQQWQSNLQCHFGGQPMSPVHVTFQRFSYLTDDLNEELFQDLQQRLTDYKPVPVTGVGLKIIHSPFHKAHLLKCEIDLNESLALLGDMVQACLDAHGIVGHYPTRVANHVTTLKNIQPEKPLGPIDNLQLPIHLFTDCTLVMSIATGTDKFAHIGKIKLT